MRPHILVFNQYYPPDTASTGRYAADICEYFAQKGALVSVITATPNYTPYPSSAPLVEKRKDVDVYRVPMGFLVGSSPLFKKVAGYAYYLIRAKSLARTIAKSSPLDGVLCFHNPPFLPAIALPIARQANACFLYCPQDIHPDALYLSRRFCLPKSIYPRWKQWHQRVLHASDRIIVLSKDMRETLCQTGIDPEKIVAIPPWCNLSPIDPKKRLQARHKLGIQNSLLVIYTGNMGSLHPLDPLLHTAHLLKRRNILFFLIGDGIGKPQGMQKKWLQNIWNVQFFPYQQREDYELLLSAADLGVLCLQNGAEKFSIPSRITSYLASGLPVLAFMSPQCETALKLMEFQCGWLCSTAPEANCTLSHLQMHHEEISRASARALSLAQTFFSPERNLALYWGVLQKTLQATPPFV